MVLDNGRLNGRKIFCTGSIYAEVIMVTARRPGEDRQTLAAFLPVDAPGLTVDDRSPWVRSSPDQAPWSSRT